MKTVENKDNFLDSLNWITKDRALGGWICNEDISLTVVGKEKKTQVNLIVRNGLSELLSDTGYIRLAISDSRLYIAPASARIGYKLCSNSKGTNDIKYCKFRPADINAFKHFIGDYELNHDVVHNVYYIERQ